MQSFKNIHEVTFKIDLESLEKNNKEAKSNPYSLEQIHEKEIKQTFKTKFNFLNDHKGIQQGHLHILLGRTNKGKSALVQSLICENMINGYKTLLLLSEGEKGDIKRIINSVLSLKYKEESTKIETMKNLILISERDLNFSNIHDPQSWINSFFYFIKEYKIEIAYIDNFSTCTFADSSPDIQAQFVKFLCQKIQDYNIPLFGVVHQSKSVSPDKELEIEDIRANSAFMNSPSFVYALNNFSNVDDNLRIIKILKSRLDGKIIGNYYEVTFRQVKSEGFYSKDQKLDKCTVKSIISSNKQQIYAKKYQRN